MRKQRIFSRIYYVTYKRFVKKMLSSDNPWTWISPVKKMIAKIIAAVILLHWHIWLSASLGYQHIVQTFKNNPGFLAHPVDRLLLSFAVHITRCRNIQIVTGGEISTVGLNVMSKTTLKNGLRSEVKMSRPAALQLRSNFLNDTVDGRQFFLLLPTIFYVLSAICKVKAQCVGRLFTRWRSFPEFIGLLSTNFLRHFK